MRKIALPFAFLVVFAMLSTTELSATCNPEGPCSITGCLGWYNWVANRSFYDGSNCWTLYGNATVKTDSQMCTGTPYVEFGLGFSSTLLQVVHIPGPGEPGYRGSDHFSFDYWVHFIDPHQQAYNILTINLYDNDTGAHLQWITTINGAQANPNCVGGTLEFHNANLLGKNVRIYIQARSIYSDTKIRITNTALWQRP